MLQTIDRRRFGTTRGLVSVGNRTKRRKEGEWARRKLAESYFRLDTFDKIGSAHLVSKGRKCMNHHSASGLLLIPMRDREENCESTKRGKKCEVRHGSGTSWAF
jgi:hypothetical protein